jgi:hypothetical protein
MFSKCDNDSNKRQKITFQKKITKDNKISVSLEMVMIDMVSMQK